MMASVVDGMSSVACELKYTGQRLLTTHTYAIMHTLWPCADIYTIHTHTHICEL